MYKNGGRKLKIYRSELGWNPQSVEGYEIEAFKFYDNNGDIVLSQRWLTFANYLSKGSTPHELSTKSVTFDLEFKKRKYPKYDGSASLVGKKGNYTLYMPYDILEMKEYTKFIQGGTIYTVYTGKEDESGKPLCYYTYHALDEAKRASELHRKVESIIQSLSNFDVMSKLNDDILNELRELKLSYDNLIFDIERIRKDFNDKNSN